MWKEPPSPGVRPFWLDQHQALQHPDDQGMVFSQNLVMGDSLDY